MRILIDESLPVKFATLLAGHDVSTVRNQGWRGLRNGVLLRTAVEHGFQLLVTADQSLRHQQNVRAIGIAVVVIAGTRTTMALLRPMIPKILSAVAIIQPGEVIEIRPR
ncbi:MAG TPA: DUF5615 family PIN-like protein [Thermoanaerobaculia bacterium]|nr:DUF5615 family PIN-like protein [Thermoanaerobaculia bacterium]